MIFIESRAFTRAGQALLSEGQLLELQQRLLKNPSCGDLMPGTGGLRKLRIGLSTRGKGKRGGARVIYYHLAKRNHLHLLLLYAKAQREDLTPGQKKILRQMIQEIESS